MDSPPRDSDPSRKKKSKDGDDDGTRSKSTLRRSFKWLLDRGSRKRNPPRSEDEEERGNQSGSSRSETAPDPDSSGFDLFGQSPGAIDRSDRGEGNESPSDNEVEVERRPIIADQDRTSKSTPGRKRLAPRSLTMTSDSSSDSEVEFNHLCGTSKSKGKKGSGKGKRKKGFPTEDQPGGKGEGKRLKGKTSKVAKRREEDSGSEDDDDFNKVLVQVRKSASGDAIASTSGLRTSTSAGIAVDENDASRFVEAPMEEDEFERNSPRNNDDENDDDDEIGEERNNAKIMVVKRGKKSGGRSGSTWPRQTEAASSSQAAAAGSSVAATHPRGRSNRPGVSSGEARSLIKSPSQKSAVGGGGGGGDVEVRVRTTARGTSVSVLLPSAAGSGGNEANTSVSGRSSSSRDVRSGSSSMQPSQTTTLQRRRQASGGRRNSLPVSAHHSVLSPPLPPSTGYSASTTASSPDMTEDAPSARGNGALSQSSAASLASRRTSIIQIDDDEDDEDDDEEAEDDDVVLVEYERSPSTVRAGSRDFPDVIEERDDDSTGSGSPSTSSGPSQSRSPDAVGVINQIDDDARLARQLQEEFDREMASSLAREMERDRSGGSSAGRAEGSGGAIDEPGPSGAGFGEDGVIVPGAPGPYYDVAARRRRLSRVLATASSHVGAVSRVPPARRRAGGGVGGGAFPLQLSLDFGFGSPLSGVVGSDITAEDVEAILDEDEDDSNNESSNDSDVLFDESRESASRGAISSAFDLVLGNQRSSRITSALRAEGRASSSSSARRGTRSLASIRRGIRSTSSPSVQNEGRQEEEDEQEQMDVDDGEERETSPHESAPNIAIDPAPSVHAPRRSRRLQRGPASGLLSATGGLASRAATSAASSRIGVNAALTPLLGSSAQSTSLNDIVGVPMPRVTSTVQLSSSSTSVDRGPTAPSGPRGLLRGRLARANLTSSTPALNTLGLSVAPTASSRGPRPLSTSRSPSRGPRTTRGRARAVSESHEGGIADDGSSGATTSDASASDGNSTDALASTSAAAGSAASCPTCEGIQNRIQTYLQEVRALQDTPVEGYDANFERMRVTTHLMRQTNDAMREWRSHTTQSMHHSLEERTHRLNTMSAIYRQISEIIQGAVRGLSPGSLASSSRPRSTRASRSSRENPPTTSSAGASSSRTARGQRYPGESTNPQFQFRRPRAPSLTPRLFIGQLPPGRLISFANGWPADLDYEALLRLGDIMGDVVPQGLSQTQINRLPTHIYDKQKASASSSSSTGEREDHKQCHVCLTEYESGEQLRILPCFHRFHSACIDEWIKTNPTCPLCRVRVEFDD